MLFFYLFVLLVPSVPMFSHACEANIKTEEICLSWLKPEGGNELHNYILEWMIIQDNITFFDTIPYNAIESNHYTISNVQPAQAVTVSIRANNSAGEGEASLQIYKTGGLFLCSML